MIKYIIYGFVITILSSCNNPDVNKAGNNIKNVSEEEYNRDILYINYTIHQFIDKKYKDYDIDSYTKEAIVHVDTILYSKDKLKLFSLIIVEKDKKQTGKLFHGRGIIAYRNNIHEKWRVYPLRRYISSWKDYNGARNVIRSCYFEKLKGTRDKYKNEFNYGIGENEFWNDLFFQKGHDIDSLYYFQTDWNYKSKKNDLVFPYLEIDYPQNILDLFDKLPNENNLLDKK